MNIFIMPAGKNTGKTVITAGLAALMQSLGYFSGVFKPVQTGAIEKNGFLISKDTAFITHIPNKQKLFSRYLQFTGRYDIIKKKREQVNQ